MAAAAALLAVRPRTVADDARRLAPPRLPTVLVEVSHRTPRRAGLSSTTSVTRRPGSRAATGPAAGETALRRELRRKGIEPAIIEGALAARDGAPGDARTGSDAPGRGGQRTWRLPSACWSDGAPPWRVSPTHANAGSRRTPSSPATASTRRCAARAIAQPSTGSGCARRRLTGAHPVCRRHPIRTRLVARGTMSRPSRLQPPGRSVRGPGWRRTRGMARRPCPDGTRSARIRRATVTARRVTPGPRLGRRDR